MIKQAERLRLFALAGLATASILSYGRTFTGTSWIFPALISAWLSISAAHTLRLTKLWRTTAFAVAILLGIWFIALVIFPQTTVVGLPTPKSFVEVVKSSAGAWARTQEEFAPVAPNAGFLTLLMGSVWIAGALSVLLLQASSFRQSLAAMLPWAAIFGYSAAVGTTSGRQAYVALFILALIVYMFGDTWRSVTRTPHFSGASSASKPPRLIDQTSLAAKIGFLSVAGAFVVPIVIPGYGASPVIPWSDTGPTKRTEISPFVQIAPRLTEASRTTLFTVKANRPAYWRLTSLNRFNGRTWELEGDFERTGRKIKLSKPPQVAVAEVIQEYRISGLAGGWVPAAYAPSSIEGIRVLVDPVRDTLLTDSLQPENRFRIISEEPQPTAAQLQSAAAVGTAREFLELPADLPPFIAELTREITKDAPTPYEKAIAIQQHLRRFTYDENITPGHSADYLVRFLSRVKAGYCEQFAGAMGVMLRTLKIPARVAVGFLPGIQEGSFFTVTNKEAHAWPEAYFSGIGWVAFEPTPRSEASPPAYAAVATPADQQTPPPPDTLQAPAEPTVQNTPPGFANELESTPEPPTRVPKPIDFAWKVTLRILAGSAILLAVLLVIKQAWLFVPALLASTPRARAWAAFREFLARAADVSRRRGIEETFLEYARAVSDSSAVPLDRLSPVVRAYHLSEYSNGELDDDSALGAADCVRQLRRSFWKASGWGKRVRILFSPMPLVDALQRVARVRSSIRASSAARSV